MAPETDPRVNLTPHQKALTFQHPNERELKNEARWLYCWNLWKEIIRQQVEICTPDKNEHFSLGVSASSSSTTAASKHNIPPVLFCHEQNDKSDGSKEALIQELQNHIITKPVQTLSKVKTIRRIKEIRLKLDIWEKCRHEGVVFLSSLQLSICEYKTGERELDKENYKMLESFKKKVLDKIVIMCKNIDFYMKQLEEAIDTFKNHRSCGIFIDPVVVKSIEKFNKRNSQPFVLPELDNKNTMESTNYNSSSNPSSVAPSEKTVSSTMRPKRRSSKSKRNDSQTSSSHSNFVLDIPDFTETLFSGCQPPKIKSESDQSQMRPTQSSTTQQNSEDGCLVSSLLNPNNDSENNDIVVKEAIKRYLKILQQGTEWYFSWSQFTEKALKEIKNLAPLLGSEVLNYMTKHINKQINLLKGLVVEIRCMGEKTKRLGSDSAEEMRVMTTCLSVLDDFVSLVESVKHEASYLIRYVEIALINLGVLDLNKEPLKIQPLRLYLMRNVISMKDCQLLASVDYLYKEMGFLLEFIEFRFHQKDKYLERFGQVTADILKKYTKNRKEVIQEKEFMNIENVNKLELAREICSTDGSFGGHAGICRTPLSRYQRAEDLRKWVEESKKNLQTLHASKSKTKSGSSSISASMPLPTNAAECENVSRIKKSSLKKEFKTPAPSNPLVENSENGPQSLTDPGLNVKGKDREKHVSFWKSTKSSAHSLKKEMKKKLSLKKKQ